MNKADPAIQLTAEDQEDLRALCQQIQDGKCILILGPGASIQREGNEDVPVNVLLARALSRDPEVAATPDLNCDDLRHVAQIFFGRKRKLAVLQNRVADFFKERASDTTPFHTDIAALPFRTCITTTPDDFLFNAMIQVGKTPNRQFYNFRKATEVQLAEPTIDRPLIYHLYGYREDPTSLVITQNDLIDFLVSIIRGERQLPPRILAQMSDPETTCLFVDVGFKNWYVRVLLRALKLDEHREVSLALEDPEFFAQATQHQTMVYFSASKTIQFRQISLPAFAAALRSMYEASFGAQPKPEPEPSPGSPRVFLSYAGEDKDKADQLRQLLNAAGISVWQDKQNLRAGDNWYRQLEQVIMKQVDYFVVIQTPAMVKQTEGYFYDEIKKAKQRKDIMSEASRFILPILLDGVAPLPELESLHCIPLDLNKGIDKLIISIMEDWQRRANKPPEATKA